MQQSKNPSASTSLRPPNVISGTALGIDGWITARTTRGESASRNPPYVHRMAYVGRVPRSGPGTNKVADASTNYLGSFRSVYTPGEPPNNGRPSLRVMSIAFAVGEPSRAANAFTETQSPTLNEFFVQLRLSRLVTPANSNSQVVTLPSGSSTTSVNPAWGFCHSIVLTVPVISTGLDASYCTGAPWWASPGAAAHRSEERRV